MDDGRTRSLHYLTAAAADDDAPSWCTSSNKSECNNIIGSVYLTLFSYT